MSESPSPTTGTAGTKTAVPAMEGWFAPDADPPHLIGTRCTRSGTYFFPPERTMSRVPGFADSPLEEVALSRTGTLWSYTNAGYQPPEPYLPVTDPFEPFAIAAVELADEQMVVLGQVVRRRRGRGPPGGDGNGAGGRRAVRGRRAPVHGVEVEAHRQRRERPMSDATRDNEVAVLGAGMHEWGKWGQQLRHLRRGRDS